MDPTEIEGGTGNGTDDMEVDTLVVVPRDTLGLRLIPTREHLPTRRGGYNQKLVIGTQTVYLRTGEYPDGRLGEIFIDVSRTGTALRAMFNAIAMSVSRALQYGVPLQEFIDAFKDFKFEPSGPVRGDPRMTESSSLLDCIFRELEMTYILKNLPEIPAEQEEQEDANADQPEE